MSGRPQSARRLRVPSLKAACVGLLLALSGCDGFADLPLPERESGAMTVEGTALAPWRQGLVQLAIDVPDDALGPYLLVVPPVVSSGAALTVHWAHGACDGMTVTTPPPAGTELTICVALWLVSDETSPTFTLEAVVDAYGSGRRFNVGVEISP